MSRMNCWEFKKCGRQPGGNNTRELGICPASVETRTDKVNNGKNGGRVCWVIAGTFCEGKKQGSFASKIGNCLSCEFYYLVQKEEIPNFKTPSDILSLLK